MSGPSRYNLAAYLGESERGHERTIAHARNKRYSYITEGSNVQNLRILNKVDAPLIDGQAGAVAFTHILELGDPQSYSGKGRDEALTINSLTVCKFSILSSLSLTDLIFSSKPSSSTTSRAALSIKNESGWTL